MRSGEEEEEEGPRRQTIKISISMEMRRSELIRDTMNETVNE